MESMRRFGHTCLCIRSHEHDFLALALTPLVSVPCNGQLVWRCFVFEANIRRSAFRLSVLSLNNKR